MSYHRIGFTPDQETALAVSADELRALPAKDRADLLLRARDMRMRRRFGFFEAIGAIATAAALLGLVGKR